MSTIEGSRRREVYRQLSGTLLDDVRRHTVRVLRDDETVAVTELAERVRETLSSSDAPPGARVPLPFRLHERDLPVLVDNGLAHWDRSRGTVTSTYHPVYHRQQPAALLATHGLEALAAAFDSARRRRVVAAFESASGPVTCEALARRVAATESDGRPGTPLVRAVGDDLCGTHLDQLEAVDVVEYDRARGTVAYTGPPELATVLARRVSPAARLERSPVEQV